VPTTEDFNLAGRHVVLGLPAYDGRFPAAFQRAVVETMTSCRHHGVTVTLAERTKSALIDKTRDEIVHGFLHKTEGTDLLMIDSDIVWEGEDVLRLLAWTGRYGFVVGPYCTKTSPPQFYYDLEPTPEGKVDQNKDGLIRLRSAPGGFNCVARDRLEKMVEAYPELRYRASRGEFKGDEITALHMMYLRDNPDGSRSRIGEDIAFCNRYRERVGNIWMDPAIVLAHLGEQEYRMSYIDWIAKQQTKAVGRIQDIAA
jgi:hypothetical protein